MQTFWSLIGSRRRCYFYHFLEPLGRAVPLVQTERRLAITENLDFDVARGLHALHEHSSIPEAAPPTGPLLSFQFCGRADDAHASTAAAVRTTITG